MAHQVVGIVLRDFGDVPVAIRELRHALRLARQAGLAEREADVLASLGAALVEAGRTPAGLAAFDQALAIATGVLAGRVLHRRGIMRCLLGQYPAALDDLRQAVAVLQSAGDTVWAARAVNARGMAYLGLGRRRRAEADFRAAELLFAQTSQQLEAIHPVHNRAMAALLSGDLPEALSCLDEAAERYQALSVPTPALISIDRCAALLAAGLAADALTEAEAAVGEFGPSRGQTATKAELLVMAATCALAAGRPQMALAWATSADRLFRSQDSAWWQAHARLVLIRARYAAGSASARLLRETEETAMQLESLGAADSAQARLLAGRVALALGRLEDADHHFTVAARSRRRGPPMARAAGWLSVALQAEAVAAPGRLFRACRRGLDMLDEHQLALGATELRAQATAHGAELAALALRHAARARRPRLLFAWSERWRATALAVPPVRPYADPDLQADLTALRQVTSEMENARRNGTPTTALAREQQRLENTVRARALRARAPAEVSRIRVDTTSLLRELGSARLAQIVDVDGVLQVLVCGAGRVRQFTAGRTLDAARAADFARFALRRLARSGPGAEVDSALAILAQAGPRLEELLLGPAVRHLGDGATVVVPPGKLHAIPWALLPVLSDRPFSVVPSAGAWLRARTSPPPDHRTVAFARGPGLTSEGAEVPVLAELYDEVTVLSDGNATASRVLGALDGAWLAHIAAHGSFRADSPLFSSLRMHDGPLTVYDFEQLRRAPYRLVLSSCESGVLAAAGTDELLGLIASLLPLGTAGIVAGVVPLNDHAVIPVMLHLHHGLRAGRTLAESLLSARQQLAGDPVQRATAASMLALGAV